MKNIAFPADVQSSHTCTTLKSCDNDIKADVGHYPIRGLVSIVSMGLAEPNNFKRRVIIKFSISPKGFEQSIKIPAGSLQI